MSVAPEDWSARSAPVKKKKKKKEVLGKANNAFPLSGDKAEFYSTQISNLATFHTPTTSSRTPKTAFSLQH